MESSIQYIVEERQVEHLIFNADDRLLLAATGCQGVQQPPPREHEQQLQQPGEAGTEEDGGVELEAVVAVVDLLR